MDKRTNLLAMPKMKWSFELVSWEITTVTYTTSHGITLSSTSMCAWEQMTAETTTTSIYSEEAVQDMLLYITPLWMEAMCKVKWLWVMACNCIRTLTLCTSLWGTKSALCVYTDNLPVTTSLCFMMALIGKLLSSLRHPYLEETWETRSPLCILCCCVIDGGAVAKLFLCMASLIRLHLYKDSSPDVDVLQQSPSFSWFGCLSLGAHLSLSCAGFTHL